MSDEDTGSPGGWSIGNQHRTADISSGADTSMANSFSWADGPSGRVVRMGLKAVLDVTVQFGAANYTVSEGGTEDVSVTLSADPERMVVIPLTHTPRGGATAADYSGVPPSVTFNRGEMEQTFTFTAVQDTKDDDEEHVELGFGAPLGSGVSEGIPAKTSVNIAEDDNDLFVAVRFAQATYQVVEGERATVRVALDADPERTVTIPIRKTNQHGATNDDYAGVPPNVTINAGQTSATFEFMAVDDNSADAGESVRLTFGTISDARVSEGSPNEAIVAIREASGEFSLDCDTAVWCAGLGLADQSKVDWGWANLYYSGSTDPPSTLSEDTFTFRGTKYLVSRAGLKAGTYPTLPNDWSRERQHSTKFWIYVSAGFPGPVPSRDHYQDWVLHLGGITLPFKEAVSAGAFGFEWIEGDLQELYNDYTAATPVKIGIEEVAAADQPPVLASPRLPREVEVWSEGRDQLTIHWMWPRWTHFSWERGIPDATGYLVQWKRASDRWGDAGKVSQREVAARDGKCCYYVRTTGLAQNTLYTARVIAFNEAGDGPRRTTRWAGPRAAGLSSSPGRSTARR